MPTILSKIQTNFQSTCDSIYDATPYSVQGIIKGHSPKKMAQAAVAGALQFSTISIFSANFTNTQCVKAASMGAALGLTANIIHKELGKRFTIINENKKINLLIAGIVSSSILINIIIPNNYSYLKIGLIPFLAPVAILSALVGR